MRSVRLLNRRRSTDMLVFQMPHPDPLDYALCHGLLLWLNYRMFSRVVEPHVVGLDDEGQVVLVAWQVSGGSESQPPTGWKTFRVAEILGAHVLSESVDWARAQQIPAQLQPRTIRRIAGMAPRLDDAPPAG